MTEKTLSRKIALKLLGAHIQRYWYLLIGSLLFAVGFVILSLYVPKLVGSATDLIVAEGNVDITGVVGYVIKILIVVALAAISQYVMNLCNNRLTYNVIRDVRQEAFEAIQTLPLARIDRRPSGELVSKVIVDVDQLAEGLLMGFSQIFTGVITIVFTLFYMFIVNWLIAVVVVVLTPLSIVIARFVANHTFDMFKLQSEIRASQTDLIDSSIKGARVVQAFNRQEKTIEAMEEESEKLEKAYLRATFFSSLVNPSTRFVNNIVYAFVAVVGSLVAIKTSQTSISVGGLVCVLAYATQYMKPFNEISGVIAELQNALACASRVFGLIEEDKIVDDGEKTLEDVAGDIEVQNVDFSYIKDKPVLKDVNIDVKSGDTIAIIGETGGGKTTFINLLMRFYDVDNGSIKVDGIDIRELSRKSLRDSFGMVLQDTWVRNQTVADNIRFGNPDASDEEVVAVAKEAHAHNFIKKLPDGYNTMIAEDGENLSLGERQLLCIARVMLDLPPMLILDEATSSIDTRTEKRIQRAFDKMMNGRTTFIVAHRLSTIEKADVVLKMENGTLKKVR
ncbi:MAG: ABC transporter ATP-binding protein [Eubacterium sp.]|nr:ABC transporter ATP-binding protein [Eubacterium sp.]